MIQVHIDFDEANGKWNWNVPTNPVMTLGLLEMFKSIYIAKIMQDQQKISQPAAADLAALLRRQ